MNDQIDGSANLSQEVRHLRDERTILDRLHKLCSAIDGPDEAAWLDCFNPDGFFTWAASAEADLQLDLRGHSALAEWFTQHRQSKPLGTQTHVVLHPVVEISDGSALVRSSYLTLRLVGSEIVVASTGYYVDRLTRYTDGSWRFAEHVAVGIMSRS